MAQANGVNLTAQTPVDVSNILKALELVHNSSSANDRRQEASKYLEDYKQRGDAVEVGYALSTDTNQQPLIRHYGLSLLEHVIRHQGHNFAEQQGEQLKQAIINLAQTLHATPQTFIRNKIGSLWVELAKRSWALDWFDLDEYLVQLWERDAVHKEFVLAVLENLSEDVFVREDATAVLRDRDLNNAVVEIFTSPQNYAGGLKIGDTTYHMRHGDEGWTTRITKFLSNILQSDISDATSKRSCLSALATLRSIFLWIMPAAIAHAKSLSVVCNCLTREDSDIILAAVDTLLSLYGRARLEEIEIQGLVYPLCESASVQALHQVYSWSVVGPDDVLDPRYTISKKIAELAYHLATWAVHYPPPSEIDFAPFLRFLLGIAQHDSLIVSIAALHSWEKFLQSSSWRRISPVQSCIQDVLQFAMQRVIAYDQLPEDTDEPAVLFVNDEIELFPERQGFYLNYRKFCFSIIELISYAFLDHALTHILTEVDSNFDQILAADSALDLSQYKRSSLNSLRAEAQFTVIDAAFRGLDRWRRTQETDQDGSAHPKRQMLLERMKQWSSTMLETRQFKDPTIRQRQIKCAVEVSNRILTSDTEFAFKVLQYILSSFMPLTPEFPLYSDTMGELHSYASTELRRLALEHASYFVTFYDQLESKFGDITTSSSVDKKVQIDLKSTLFLVVEHAAGIDPNLRQDRLRSFLEPMMSAWSEQTSMLSSFEAFSVASGFDQVVSYMAKINAEKYSDWTEISFGEDAANIQADLVDRSARIPLRETRVLLSVSTERLEPESEKYQMMCELWVPLLPSILDNVFRIVSYCHKLHDPSSWPNASLDKHHTISRMLRDRYWQSGISGGSMNEFHAKVKATKSTLEGFASSVRGRIRVHLENCYSIIHTAGRLGSYFYSMTRVPEMIAEALLDTTEPLGTHHFGTLLSMLPKLIEECPQTDRENFLPPVLSSLLVRMDARCSAGWQKLHEKGESGQQSDSLNDEMREESVLRQTTYRAVNMVSFWLDPQREQQLASRKGITNRPNQSLAGSPPQSFRDFVLSNRRIMEPLIVFCTHAISYRDTKTCATMVTALQKFVPAFATEMHMQGPDAAAVREYTSTEMLKAVINSLNDGYFADYQNQLATLIALIWLAYGLPAHVPATENQPAHERPAWTETPRNVLISIPGLSQSKVDDVGRKLVECGLTGSTKKMRALILHLLEGVRGVRISEIGKYDTKQQKSTLLQKYKLREAAGMQGIEDQQKQNGDEPNLEGMQSMFG